MADLLVDVQGTPLTPSAGQCAIYVDNVTKKLTTKNDAGEVDTVDDVLNSSAANQTGFASDTYLSGSPIAIPPGLVRAKSRYYLCFDMTKTAAGTAAPTVIVRFGTNGTTADAARLTFTFAAGTAAIDAGVFEVFAHWRSVGASSVLVGVCRLTHALAATGLTTTGASGSAALMVTSSAFDSTVANSIVGVSFNGGASFSGTNVLQQSSCVGI